MPGGLSVQLERGRVTIAGRNDLTPDCFEERVETLAGGRRHSVERNAALVQIRLESGETFRFVQRIDLVGGDQLRLVGEPFACGIAAGNSSSSRRITW